MILSLKALVAAADPKRKIWYDLQEISKEPDVLFLKLGEVQKSGAPIYFRPSNNDFTSNCKDYFSSYSEAYKSEDW